MDLRIPYLSDGQTGNCPLTGLVKQFAHNMGGSEAGREEMSICLLAFCKLTEVKQVLNQLADWALDSTEEDGPRAAERFARLTVEFEGVVLRVEEIYQQMPVDRTPTG